MSTMKCRSCHSPMVVERCESSGNATTCWHQCPLCKQVRLTSDPVSARPSTTSEAYRYDDAGYLNAADAAYSDPLPDSAYLIS